MRAPSHHLTVAEASRLIRARKLSPVEYVDLLAQRITEIDPQLHAFIAPTVDHARRQAVVAEQEIMAGRYRGPMHGIPYGAKDIFETSGIATTGGSRTARNHVPDRDAAIVTRLNAAGALLIGKLATHEFAHGGPSFDLPWPPVRNPWALERFAGGSSSGSGAAVAAGLVPCALGSDTGGSIRGPASFCGIAGFMPSSGLVSRAGVMPNSYSLDHCGPMAWTVEDCAIMLQAIAGYDPADGNSVEQAIPDFHGGLGDGMRGLRVGVLRSVWEDEIPAAPEHRAALEQAVETMRQLGAIAEDCQVAPMQDYMDVKVVIAETEIFSVHQLGLAERAGGRIRTRLPDAHSARSHVPVGRLPGCATAPAQADRTNATALSEIRLVPRTGFRAGAAACRAPAYQLLAQAKRAGHGQHHGRAGACGVLRIHIGRPAARDAADRKARRRRACALRRGCL